MDARGLEGVLDALRSADEDLASYYDEASRQVPDEDARHLLQRLARGHRADAAEVADELARFSGRIGPRGATRGGGWGTGGHGTGDQFGGGEGGGAGGFPSAGPSYSGGRQDLNTGE